jgi:hypothetical protein
MPKADAHAALHRSADFDTTEQGDSRQAYFLLRTREASTDRCHRRIQVPQVVIVQIQQMDAVFPQQVEERCAYALFCL